MLEATVSIGIAVASAGVLLQLWIVRAIWLLDRRISRIEWRLGIKENTDALVDFRG